MTTTDISEIEFPKADIFNVYMTSDNNNKKALSDGNLYDIAHSNPDLTSHANGFIISLNLKHITNVKRIKVYNRVDCCQERIIGFSVFIKNQRSESEVNCGKMDDAKLEYLLDCEGTGNVVQLRKEGTVGLVNLAEVEVYGGGFQAAACQI